MLCQSCSRSTASITIRSCSHHKLRNTTSPTNCTKLFLSTGFLIYQPSPTSSSNWSEMTSSSQVSHTLKCFLYFVVIVILTLFLSTPISVLYQMPVSGFLRFFCFTRRLLPYQQPLSTILLANDFYHLPLSLSYSV